MTKAFTDKLNAARDAELYVDSLWQHYKGGVYKVLGLTLSTDDTEVLVRYCRIAGPDYNMRYDQRIEWSRPMAEWFDDMGDTPRFWPVFECKAYISPNPEAPFFPPLV